MKTILAVAICLAIATPAMCQSTSAPKGQQEKEPQLRTALEQMRDAIDHYHGMFTRGKIMAAVDSNGYPPDLQTLVNGVEAQGKTIHFLRKIPIDPMTGTTDWVYESVAECSMSTASHKARLWTARSIRTGKW